MRVDATHAYTAAKQKGVSFFLSYFYAVLSAANEIEEFRYRFDKDGNVVTAPEDCASYNFADPNTDPAGHFYRDVLPWIAWGNDEADSTDMSARLKAFVFAGGGNAVKNRVMPRGKCRSGR